MSTPNSEGRIPVPGGDVWFKSVGAGVATPLLTLHGGPGVGHDYLEPLAALGTDRPVVFYDQLGCGRSDKPDDPSLWRIDRFVQELAAVREALGLDRVHLLGHSWGGWLAIEYMMGNPSGVASLTLASTSASLPQWAGETACLVASLPEGERETIRRCEEAGDLQNPAYEAAMMEFYQRYVCRSEPWPEPLLRSLNNLMGDPVAHSAYVTMQGPTEFTITGNLKDWDRTAHLGEIGVPTLLTFGRYDEFTPACAETLSKGIRKAELHVFEESSHMAHLEEPEEYARVLRSFLERVEGTRQPD
ncbi:MAG: proline iminopeptidase-family hydrolase [Gemmatimonadales bacterium]|nr:proline iminopeptidase-family hydrolase [Gemmatimonadales bacterium]MDZ4389592.1 proline iminopeptidase-family hydrolase [Gemmatimonadales bacterium]